MPLIHGDKGGALGARGLYDEIRMMLEAVASELQDTKPADAALLREVSPHWLRHAYARIERFESTSVEKLLQGVLRHREELFKTPGPTVSTAGSPR